LLRLFLKGVQDVHGLGESRDVDHSVCSFLYPYSKLLHSLADGWHWFEISRLIALLHVAKLKAGDSLGERRKGL
jgi:hypothetical protein